VKAERKLEATKAVRRDRLISNQRRRNSSNNVGEEAVHRCRGEFEQSGLENVSYLRDSRHMASERS